MNYSILCAIFLIMLVAVVALRYYYIKGDERAKKIVEVLSDDAFIERAKKLIIQAEMFIVGTKRGQERLSWVVDCLWNYIPEEIAPYVSRGKVIAVVNTIFEKIAVKLEDGTRVAKE